MVKTQNSDGLASCLAKMTLQGTVKGKEEKVDKRGAGQISFESRKEKTLPAQLGQLKTGQDRKGLFRSHLRCPHDIAGLLDRIDLIEGQ